MMLSENVNNKKCAPKLVFFKEKNEKDSDDFWHRKLTLKVKFSTAHYTNNFLWVHWFWKWVLYVAKVFIARIQSMIEKKTFNCLKSGKSFAKKVSFINNI